MPEGPTIELTGIATIGPVLRRFRGKSLTREFGWMPCGGIAPATSWREDATSSVIPWPRQAPVLAGSSSSGSCIRVTMAMLALLASPQFTPIYAASLGPARDKRYKDRRNGGPMGILSRALADGSLTEPMEMT
jgi:hypothetical protein